MKATEQNKGENRNVSVGAFRGEGPKQPGTGEEISSWKNQVKAPYSTVILPDGIVIGGPWPNTIIAWPNGNSRGATKPEYDLFQALEKAHAEIERLKQKRTKTKAKHENRDDS